MSIEVAVRRLVDDKKLIHRPSSLVGISARDLFVTPEIHALAHPPFADTELGVRQAALAAYFDAYCERNEMTVSQNPRKKPWDTMLARVDPPETQFWSMRITDPEDSPGMRVLGGFCWTDGFVALTFDYREKIGTDFDGKVNEIAAAWNDYFGQIGPHRGETMDAYLTGYYEYK